MITVPKTRLPIQHFSYKKVGALIETFLRQEMSRSSISVVEASQFLDEIMLPPTLHGKTGSTIQLSWKVMV